MHVEGGPEASLSVHAGGVDLDLNGSYETGFNENDDEPRAVADPERARGPAPVTARARPVGLQFGPRSRSWRRPLRRASIARCPAAEHSRDRRPARRAWLTSGAGGGGGAATTGTGAGGGGGAVTTGTGAGGGGGSAIGCPHARLPPDLLPLEPRAGRARLRDLRVRAGAGPRRLRGFHLRAAAAAAGGLPGTGDDVRPARRPVRLDDQVQTTPAVPGRGVRHGSSTTFRPRRVTTARCSLPQCTRDPDATCRWHYTDCPPSCVALATREKCDRVAGCQWLIRACAEPTIPATGCVDKGDLNGCSSAVRRAAQVRPRLRWIPARFRPARRPPPATTPCAATPAPPSAPGGDRQRGRDSRPRRCVPKQQWKASLQCGV